MNAIQERTIALAGVIQACELVQSLARTGHANVADERSLLKSINVLDAVNAQSVYGGLGGVRSGLSAIAEGILNATTADNIELLKYTMQVLTLQQVLYKSDGFARFAQAVEQLSGYGEDELIAASSDLYQAHISPLRPQIIVQGEEQHLQAPEVPPKIRAMLLAALRSAVLWQQKGGGRFRLLWERTRMRNAARELIAIH